MQTLFEVHYPSLDIQILGVNEIGHESQNAQMTAEGDLPWLQDLDRDDNGTSDVWDEVWENVTYRDVQIVDKNGDVADIFNVTSNNLADSAKFDELRDKFLALAATPALSIWQSPIEPLDINGDGRVAPIDALIAINALNEGESGPFSGSLGPQDPRMDVTGDGQLSPIDPLFVINHLNRNSLPPQAALSSAVVEDATPVDAVFASYADDVEDDDDDE